MKKRAAARKKPARAKAKGTAKAPRRVAAVPEAYGAITPQLTVRGAAEAIDFYKRAFGARELMRMAAPDGKVMHAELKMGGRIFFVVDEMPEWGPGPRAPQTLGGVTGSLHVYVPNVDAAVRRAVDAGATVKMPVADMFWGDRFGKVADPFGHEWGLATHTEDVTPAEARRRGEAFMKQQSPQHA
jgi:PhnB protein